MLRPYIGIVGLTALFMSTAPPLTAQDSSSVGTPSGARWGSAFLIPFGSMVVPGLGQYIDGGYLAGAAYTGTAAAGLVVGLAAGSADVTYDGGLPRSAGDQISFEAIHVHVTARYLSAWDAFYRAVPAFHQEGKYEFLTTRESLGDLMTAPFDPEFLGRKTTWLSLVYTGLVAGLVVAGRDPGPEYEPFRPRDAAFTGALSYNAAVGEEAVFRSWLLPMLHQKTGERFWLANALQAGIFGALHAEAGAFAAVIAASGLYDGWVTRRNDWSVREAIFHHFWYDVAVVAATLLADERQGRLRVTFPTIRF